MKKALRLLLAQVIWLFAGVLIGTFFYCLYNHSISSITGINSPVWTKENLAVSVFIVTQIFVFCSGFILIASKIRRPGGVLQLTAFILCQFLTWCLILPLSTHLERKYVSTHASSLLSEMDENQNLSNDYFRQSENEIFYFLNKNNSRAVKIETTQSGSVNVINIEDPSKLSISQNAKPYKDILIKNTFKTNNSDYSFFGILLFSAKRDLDRGLSFWIGYLTLALALASIYGISGISGWRIANFTICGILYGIVLFINGFYWAPAMTGFRNLSFLQTNFFRCLSLYFSAPLLVILNLTFSLVLIITGTAKFIIKKKRGL